MAPWYALNLRRGDVNVELTADDPVFMADEMARWLSVMGLPAASQLLAEPKASLKEAQTIPETPTIPTSLTDRIPVTTTTMEQAKEAFPVKKQSEATAPISQQKTDKNIQLPGEWIEEKMDAVMPESILAPDISDPVVTEGPATLENTADWLSKVATSEQPLETDGVTEDADTPFDNLLNEAATEEAFAMPDDTSASNNTPAADWGETALADRGQPEPDDDFERVMSTLMEDLTTQPALTSDNNEKATSVSENASDDDAPHVGVFRKEGMHGPVATALPDAAEHSNSYKALCERAGAATPEDHLLISAYAMTTTQGVERFSLSDLNAVIQGAGHDMVTHSVLAVAVDKGLLTAVADLSADATQYELTRHGRTTVEMFI